MPAAARTRDAPVLAPARQLALTLADLPPGFHLGPELAQTFDPAQVKNDPWGRLSAYSITYLASAPATAAAGVRGEADEPLDSGDASRAQTVQALPAPGRTLLGDVSSSINSYATAAQAHAAFEAWRAAVPPIYVRLDLPLDGLGHDAVAYAQEGKSVYLVGFRRRNVLASIWVGAAPDGTGTAGTPIERAVQLAGVVAARIDSGAGR